MIWLVEDLVYLHGIPLITMVIISECCLTPNEQFCNSFQYYEYIHRITNNKIKHVAMPWRQTCDIKWSNDDVRFVSNQHA
jgi:hypothetical protein